MFYLGSIAVCRSPPCRNPTGTLLQSVCYELIVDGAQLEVARASQFSLQSDRALVLVFWAVVV